MFIFEEQAKEKYAFKSSALLYSLSWYFTKPVLAGTVIYALIIDIKEAGCLAK